jgi:hypothetical protein
MSLRPGERLGAFEILGPLGAGGMGEVYRARDSKLGREVALKILPAQFDRHSERLARFEREARMLASLNHPGIGAIYGVEESPRGLLLILELVPGDTLADRIARGPLPIEEALQIARQIADAVAFAHANGVVHRDLKPANVKYTPRGAVKVLDFGLAKALLPDHDAPGATDPTVTPVSTQDGAIIGTPAYMSPEQARAKEIDRRTDVWSLGCILYEMLTGRRAFQRATITDTLVAVLGEEPDWSLLPEATPAPVRSILRRCLQRDRDRRYHDMADVRIEIDEALTPSGLAQTSDVSPARRANALRPFEWIAIGAIVLAMIVQGIFLYRLVPVQAGMYAGYGMTLPLPLRVYIGSANMASFVVPVLLLIALGVRLTGRTLPVGARGVVLAVLAIAGAVTTIAGLYFMAESGLVQAIRLNIAVGANGQVLERDLIALNLAAGNPAAAIAVLDPTGKRDDFVTPIRFAGPGRAFQLAEAYRAAGNLEAARRLYRRAQEAAVAFDEQLTPEMQTQYVQLESQFGRNITEWAPSTSVLRQFPDLVRTVSAQRLKELEGK